MCVFVCLKVMREAACGWLFGCIYTFMRVCSMFHNSSCYLRLVIGKCSSSCTWVGALWGTVFLQCFLSILGLNIATVFQTWFLYRCTSGISCSLAALFSYGCVGGWSLIGLLVQGIGRLKHASTEGAVAQTCEATIHCILVYFKKLGPLCSAEE